MLHINDLTYRVGGRLLLEKATAAIPAGRRVGLVGRNGSGKSTLLKLIRGVLEPEGGSISLGGAVRVGDMPQDPPSGPESALAATLAADRERTALLAELDADPDPSRLADIHDRLATLQSHSAEARAGAILHGLGFSSEDQARSCSDFAGGWRMRIALAGTLFADPDLLLLDEPSNHLDLEARLWLAERLRRFPGTLVLVSHDRELLNSACDMIVHIENLKLNVYQGNYDRFERTRRERLEQQSIAYARQQAERKRIQAFVDRFRAKASKARQAQSRVKMLERMEPILPVDEESSVEFRFPSPQQLAPPLIKMEHVDAGYAPGKPVLRDVSLSLTPDDRIALLGQNGNGKSTLLRMIGGRLEPLAGELRRSGRLKVGYFAQHQEEELDLAETPFDHMRRALPKAQPTQVRAHLGAFGFSGPRADQTVGSLSGGEKTRLLFALMTRDAPHVLLLDEPTNHLDMDSRQALVEALNEYEGAVILVSHDPGLVRLIADTLWLVADGAAKPFDGDLDDYARLLLADRRGGIEKDKPKREAKAEREAESLAPAAPAVDPRERRRSAAEQRQRLAPLRKTLERAERDMEKAAKKVEAAKAALNDPALYEKSAAVIRDAQLTAAETQRDLADAEERWLAAQEALDREQTETAA